MVLFLKIRRHDLGSGKCDTAENSVALLLPELVDPFTEVGGQMRRGACQEIAFGIDKKDRGATGRVRLLRSKREERHDFV